MPELPEVESLVQYLAAQAVGKEVSAVDVLSIAVLKTFDPPVTTLVGRSLTGTSRRGKYLLLEFGDDLYLVLHLARGGWVRWKDEIKVAAAKPGKGPLALRVRFTDKSGFEVTEMGTEKRLAAWVVRDPADVEHVATLGPDPLDPSFDVATLSKILRDKGRAQVKHVLTDQSLIAGVGNAYSDEALHIARLSPFKPAGNLSDDEIAALHAAVRDVLTDAVERSRDLPAGELKKEKKSGMRVHGRTGEACPVCGDTVREVSFSSKSLQYCATCQTGGKPLADRRYSRFLK